MPYSRARSHSMFLWCDALQCKPAVLGVPKRIHLLKISIQVEVACHKMYPLEMAVSSVQHCTSTSSHSVSITTNTHAPPVLSFKFA